MEYTQNNMQYISQILWKHAVDRQIEVSKNNTRFVHYTSSEAAINILRTKRFWLRNVLCMNDYSEVQHGIGCFSTTFKNNEIKYKFESTVNSIYNNSFEDIANLFGYYENTVPHNTYISCFSEHKESEDVMGRLSMWRAYGSQAGVAVVIKSGSILDGKGKNSIITTPVLYMNETNFSEFIIRIIENIQSNIDAFKKVDKNSFVQSVAHALFFIAMSTKHPGFEEEKEWRIIQCPLVPASPHLEYAIENIKGVSQPVYKIPLENRPEDGVTEIDIRSLIDRVILGPSQYPLAQLLTFQKLLTDANLDNVDQKIFLSGIPLRM